MPSFNLLMKRSPQSLPFEVVIFILTFIFLFYSFFDRGAIYTPVFSVSAAALSGASAGAVIILILIHRFMKTANVNSSIFYFLFFYTAVVLILGAWHATSTYFNFFLIFHLELAMCICFSIFGYLLLKYEILKPSRLAFLIVSSGTLFLFFSFGNAVFSFRGNRFDFSESRNYFSSAMSVVAVVSFVRILVIPSINRIFGILFYSFSFLFSCISIFMSGSKSALYAVLIVCAFLILKSRAIGLFSVIIFSGATLILAEIYDYSAIYEFIFVGLSRSSLDGLFASLFERISLWTSSLEIYSLGSLLAGRPHLYEIFDESYIQPHNIFISWFRYSGVFLASILSIITFFALYRSILILADLKSSYGEIIILAAAFFVVFVYVSVSGNATRVWHFYFILGAFLGQMKIGRANSSL